MFSYCSEILERIMLSRREKFKSFMKSKYMRNTFLEYTTTEVRTQCKSISSAYEIVDKKVAYFRMSP